MEEDYFEINYWEYIHAMLYLYSKNNPYKKFIIKV